MSLACPSIAVTVHETPSDFRLLQDGWKDLFERHGGWNVFLSWEWFHRWWQSFGDAHELHLIALRQENRLVGIVPAMVETTEGGERQFALIGSDRTTDYCDVLVAPEFQDRLLAALADTIAQGFGRWARAELRNLPQGSPLLGAFLDEIGRRGMRAEVRESATCPVARLAPTWDEYLATLSKKDRHELRRKIRRSQSCGEPQILRMERPAAIEEGLADFFRLHRASASEKAAFLDPEMETFFRRMVLSLSQRGWVRLNLMKLDGVGVAASLSFCCGDRVLLYNSGLDPECRHLCVGIALHAAEMQDAIDQGKEYYDFLRGDEPYKYDLGGRDTPIYTLTVLPQQSGGESPDGRG